jgi:Smr domain
MSHYGNHSSSSRTNNTYHDRSQFPSLDLHGYKLTSAIPKLVQFLEKYYVNISPTPNYVTHRNVHHHHHNNTKHDAVLLVVTGTGSHSGNTSTGSGSGRPVLKYAVNDFLQRHLFQYSYHSQGGYFVIPLHNNTGILSYASNACNVDTKIILTSPSSPTTDRSLVNHLHMNQTHRQSDLLLPVERQHRQKDEKGVAIPLNEMPTLQQVVYEEQELQRGIHESLDAFRIRQKEYALEHNVYKQAIQQSQQEMIQSEHDEKVLFDRVIQESVELSEREYCLGHNGDEDEEGNDDDDDDMMLKQAMMESLEESERELCDAEEEEEMALKQAMMESLEESERWAIAEQQLNYDAAAADDDNDGHADDAALYKY